MSFLLALPPAERISYCKEIHESRRTTLLSRKEGLECVRIIHEPSMTVHGFRAIAEKLKNRGARMNARYRWCDIDDALKKKANGPEWVKVRGKDVLEWRGAA